MSSPLHITELTIPSSTSELQNVRETIHRTLNEVLIPHRTAHKIVLAADEAVSNIILHSCGRGSKETITIAIGVHHDRVQIALRNKGPHFDPAAFPPPDIETHVREGTRPSLGIHLMRTILDDMQYSHNNGTCELVLTKYLLDEGGVNGG